MNELSVKTLKFEPAVVEFNYDELMNVLDSNLKKYEGLTFTEDDIPEGKKTVAELRKGKKAVDDYRKTTKKKLTESVTNFENQCKELNKRFDEVLNPLVEQMDEFEQIRKHAKYDEVHEIIDKLITDYDLQERFANELSVDDEYLNKTKTIESITDELTIKANYLNAQQETYEANKENIRNTVEIANGRYEVNLTDSAYVSLLDYKNVSEIKEQILDDAQNEAQKRLDKAKKEEVAEEAQPTPIMEEPKREEPTFFEIYKVTGTEKQLLAVENFMKSSGIKFEVKGEQSA